MFHDKEASLNRATSLDPVLNAPCFGCKNSRQRKAQISTQTRQTRPPTWAKLLRCCITKLRPARSSWRKTERKNTQTTRRKEKEERSQRERAAGLGLPLMLLQLLLQISLSAFFGSVFCRRLQVPSPLVLSLFQRGDDHKMIDHMVETGGGFTGRPTSPRQRGRTCCKQHWPKDCSC